MKQYIVDAFTEKVFGGNPAAVCVMEKWLPDALMEKIAIENNLSETAFTVKEREGGYRLRWFTPGGEVDLCGHATLATAFVLFSFVETDKKEICFQTLGGELMVTRKGNLYEMDFPAYSLRPVEVTEEMIGAMGARPQEAYLGRDLLCIFSEEKTVKEMKPDLKKVLSLPGLLLHVSAEGQKADCVSRSFAPKLNIPEDPVCGSGHCHIAPYWAEVLQKDELVAYQASKRGGTLYCALKGERVKLSGSAALYAVSEIFAEEGAKGRA